MNETPMNGTGNEGNGKPAKPATPAPAAGKPAYGPGSAFKGRKGRSGPPKGNGNAQRHGMKGSKLPKGCEYIEHRVNALRRQVEAALIAAKGEISIVDAAAVNSILKWERHGLLAAHWLRHEADKLSASDRLRFSEAIAKASDNRDRMSPRLAWIAPEPAPWITAMPLALPAPAAGFARPRRRRCQREGRGKRCRRLTHAVRQICRQPDRICGRSFRGMRWQREALRRNPCRLSNAGFLPPRAGASCAPTGAGRRRRAGPCIFGTV